MERKPASMDPYAALGVSRDACPEEVRKAYRLLALRLHPDKNPGSATAAEDFQRVSRAFAVLSDPVRRGLYDRSGVLDDVDASEDAAAAGSAFFDFLAASMAQGMKGGGEKVPSDVIDVALGLADLRNGCTRRIEYERPDKCAACDCGTTCLECGGTGALSIVSPPGMAQTFVHLPRAVPCNACRGFRTSARAGWCGVCRGTRLSYVREAFDVRVPRRTRDGQLETLRGKGPYDPERGEPGDAVLRFRHALPPGWSVDNDTFDAAVEIPLCLSDVLAGFDVTVGEVRVLSAGYRDPGVPMLFPDCGAGGHGTSLIVRFRVEFPREGSAAAARLAKLCGVFKRMFSHDKH